MQISKEADYALRAVLYLTTVDQSKPVATSTIAEIQNIPSSFLTKIISRLSSARIVKTLRGSHGGVRLARPTHEISILDVIEVIDGPVTLNECVTNPDTCVFGSTCPLHKTFCEAQALLVDRWRSTTFDQMS